MSGHVSVWHATIGGARTSTSQLKGTPLRNGRSRASYHLANVRVWPFLVRFTKKGSKTVFLDEGALDGDARCPSACAVVVDDVDTVRGQVEARIHNLALRLDYRLEASPDKLIEFGFHHVADNKLARQSFIDLLPRLDFEWWCSSNLQDPLDAYETLPDQFEWIIERILRKNKKRKIEIHFVFEQNQRLSKYFSRIVERSTERAEYPTSLVSFEVSGKREHLLAIPDYCIALSSQAIKVWREACCDTSRLRKSYLYRNFAAIEGKCSVLDAWGMPRSLSTRPSRLLRGKNYFQLSGSHDPSCTR